MNRVLRGLFSVALVALVGCANLYLPQTESDADHFAAARLLPVRGAENGDVEIVQYSSFTCSHCKSAAENVDKLLARDVGVTVMYRPIAFAKDVEGKRAARAALAAAAQGKFWEMHDLLFANQAQLNESRYVELAEQLGLDVEQFKRDYASNEILSIVEENTREAVRVGVEGTPTLFFNGQPILGSQSVSSLQASVKAARKRGQS